MSSSAQPTRNSILEDAAKKLRQEFEAIKNGIPHNGESGREAENILKTFLSSRIPKRYNVGSGFILDNKDATSPQTDIMIYDDYNTPIIEAYGDNILLPIDSLAAVIEVKSTLDKAAIHDAANKIAQVKSLKRSKPASSPLNTDAIGILFAFDTNLSIDKIADHYRNSVVENMGKHLDYIFILDLGMISVFSVIGNTIEPIVIYRNKWPIVDVIFLSGYIQYREKTLACFLRFLNSHLARFSPSTLGPSIDVKPSDAVGEGGVDLVPIMALTPDKKRETAEKAMDDFIKRVKSSGQLIIPNQE